MGNAPGTQITPLHNGLEPIAHSEGLERSRIRFFLFHHCINGREGVSLQPIVDVDK